AALRIGGIGYTGYGSAGGSMLLNGFIAMELARVDSSIATFWGVHTGLAAGSIYLCGDEEQKQRWLPALMGFDKIGSVWSDGASSRFRHIRRDDHDLSARRRVMGSQWREKMDRQRNLRGHQCDLGT